MRAHFSKKKKKSTELKSLVDEAILIKQQISSQSRAKLGHLITFKPRFSTLMLAARAISVPHENAWKIQEFSVFKFLALIAGSSMSCRDCLMISSAQLYMFPDSALTPEHYGLGEFLSSFSCASVMPHALLIAMLATLFIIEESPRNVRNNNNKNTHTTFGSEMKILKAPKCGPSLSRNHKFNRRTRERWGSRKCVINNKQALFCWRSISLLLAYI